jgi:hypothetical protein
MTSDRATKIAKNKKEMTIVNRGGSIDKLTYNMDITWCERKLQTNWEKG